jgi:AraC-like DNA-binding protein
VRSHARASGLPDRASAKDGNLPARPTAMLARPVPAAGKPKRDVLSDVLRAVRLTGAVYFDFDLSSPWVAEAPPSRDIASVVMPGAQHVIEYHVLVRGSAWGHALGEDPIRMNAGDAIVFPQGAAHVLSSAPGMRSAPDMAAFARPRTSLPLVYELGGGGPDRARLVCGFLGCDDRPYNPLLAALPSVIHVRAAAERGTPGLLGTLLGIAATEATDTRPGHDNVLARLSELIFVETVRQYVESLPPSQTGWLAGLRDPIVCGALQALHADASAAWTVERLARLAGASRSVLAERFTAMVGRPPMEYLALWRMQLASRLLVDGGQVAAVAGAVGYESEAAFSRAFKKLVGESPATWRRATVALPAPSGP